MSGKDKLKRSRRWNWIGETFDFILEVISFPFRILWEIIKFPFRLLGSLFDIFS